MLKLLRWFLGLCQHKNTIIKEEDVMWHSASEWTFRAVDMSQKNIVHHTNYLLQCDHCGRLQQKRIKRG